MPSFLRMVPRGHILEKPNWNKFSPTKAVKNSQYLLIKIGLASTPRARLRRMKKPAKECIQSVTIIVNSLGAEKEGRGSSLKSLLEVWAKKYPHLLDQLQDTLVCNFIVDKISVLPVINYTLPT